MILGLPSGPVHLEIVRLKVTPHRAQRLDQLVFYLPDAADQERITARLAAAGVDPVGQIDYWEANGGVTYQDPDGRDVRVRVLDLSPADILIRAEGPSATLTRSSRIRTDSPRWWAEAQLTGSFGGRPHGTAVSGCLQWLGQRPPTPPRPAPRCSTSDTAITLAVGFIAAGAFGIWVDNNRNYAKRSCDTAHQASTISHREAWTAPAAGLS